MDCVWDGKLGGGVVFLSRDARWLANLAECRVEYGSYWSYPAPCRGVGGNRKVDGDGGGGVVAMLSRVSNPLFQNSESFTIPNVLNTIRSLISGLKISQSFQIRMLRFKRSGERRAKGEQGTRVCTKPTEGRLIKKQN